VIRTAIQAVPVNEVTRIFTVLSRAWLNLKHDPDVFQPDLDLSDAQCSRVEVVFPACGTMKDEEFITFIRKGFMARVEQYPWLCGVRWLSSRLLSVEAKQFGSTYVMLFELSYAPDASSTDYQEEEPMGDLEGGLF